MKSELDDSAVVTYEMQYNQEKTRVILEVKTDQPITGSEYIQCLMAFIADYDKNPDLIFDPEDFTASNCH